MASAQAADSPDEYPPQLKRLIQRVRDCDPRSYWIDGLGWDIDGIQSDLDLELSHIAGSGGAGGGTGGLAPPRPSSAPGAGIRTLSHPGRSGGPAAALPPLPSGAASRGGRSASATFAGLLSVVQAKAGAGSPRAAVSAPAAPTTPPGGPAGVPPPKRRRPDGAKGGAATASVAVVSGKGPDATAASSGGHDNEGRPYDDSRVVVNFINVGTNFGKKMKIEGGFHWEGVRRCVKYLTGELKLKVVGVIFENFVGNDNLENPCKVYGIPGDVVNMCESVEETPRAMGAHHRSADDEMTIKCAYRRNCRFMDNDNYRDWLEVLQNEQMKAWLIHVQDQLHMKYYFDSGLGCFETLDGNTIKAAELQAGKGGKGGKGCKGGKGGGKGFGKACGKGPGKAGRGKGGGPGDWGERLPRHAAPPLPAQQPDEGPAVAKEPPASRFSLPPNLAPGTVGEGETLWDYYGGGGAQSSALAQAHEEQRASARRASLAGGGIGGVSGINLILGRQAPKVRRPAAPTIGGATHGGDLDGSLARATGSVSAAGGGAASDINALHEGWTALCAAVATGNMDTAKVLLERGADANIPNSQGAHPLYYAVEKWNLRLIRVLLRHGARPAIARGPTGQSVAACARQRLGTGTRATTRAATHRGLLAELGVDVAAAIAEAAAQATTGAGSAAEVVAAAAGRPSDPARPPDVEVVDLDDMDAPPKRARTSSAGAAAAAPASTLRARQPKEVIQRRAQELSSRVDRIADGTAKAKAAAAAAATKVAAASAACDPYGGDGAPSADDTARAAALDAESDPYL